VRVGGLRKGGGRVERRHLVGVWSRGVPGKGLGLPRTRADVGAGQPDGGGFGVVDEEILCFDDDGFEKNGTNRAAAAV
jgi:hypothetical protein